MDTKNKVFVVIGSVALIASAAIGGYSLFATQDNTAASTTGTSSQVSTTTSTPSSPASTTNTTTASSSATDSTSSGSYKDGTYNATVSYSVPHGATNSLKATVTVSNGSITAVSTDDSYSDHESGQWISEFESSLSSSVVGTNLASASFSRIGGASLTTDAFNNALEQIISQATA